MSPVVSFLSDYGLTDEFVGVCHGVIESHCPGVRIIDITHGIPRHDVRRGALTLRNALAYLPVGVHLAVVDPGVGSARRAVALRNHEGRQFVGPDNGLLVLAAGRVAEAVDIGDSPFRLRPVSSTFHGRDVFAPVAAALARGGALLEAGQPLDPAGLERIELSEARVEGETLVAEVALADAFGNLTLNAPAHLLRWTRGTTARVTAGGRSLAVRIAAAFSDVEEGEGLVYVDSSDHWAVAVNAGSARAALAASPGDELRVIRE